MDKQILIQSVDLSHEIPEELIEGMEMTNRLDA